PSLLKVRFWNRPSYVPSYCCASATTGLDDRGTGVAVGGAVVVAVPLVEGVEEEVVGAVVVLGRALDDREPPSSPFEAARTTPTVAATMAIPSPVASARRRAR